MSNPNAWTIARAGPGSSGDTITFRFRKAVEPAIQAALATEVSIKWRFASASQELEREMQVFEEMVAPLVDSPESILAAVVTIYPGVREWVFYCASYPEFETSLNSCLDSGPRFPLQIQWSEDPDWEVFHQLIGPVRARAAN